MMNSGGGGVGETPLQEEKKKWECLFNLRIRIMSAVLNDISSHVCR